MSSYVNQLKDQRQSVRFDRTFLVTDHEDEQFSEPFLGFDVNLTGLSFWVDNADWFLPGQSLSLRVKNLENNEAYCLDGVEVVHLQDNEDKILCGCHISKVTSSQLLSHHRMVVTDEESADQIQGTTAVEDFDFDEEGAPNSQNLSDFQELVMVSLLQYEQLKKASIATRQELAMLHDTLAICLKNDKHLPELQAKLDQFQATLEKSLDQQLAWGLYAKLLAFTPKGKVDRQNWQTMISDFEGLYLSEIQQAAFDFMHQGITARKSLAMAREYFHSQAPAKIKT